MNNDDRDRLLTRLETLLVEVLMPLIQKHEKRLGKLEFQSERQFGGVSWRGAALRTGLVIFGMVTSLVLGILALYFQATR